MKGDLKIFGSPFLTGWRKPATNKESSLKEAA